MHLNIVFDMHALGMGDEIPEKVSAKHLLTIPEAQGLDTGMVNVKKRSLFVANEYHVFGTLKNNPVFLLRG